VTRQSRLLQAENQRPRSELISASRRPARRGGRDKSDPTRLRPTDLPRVIGNADRTRRCLRWSPERRLEDTVDDVLNNWRRRCSQLLIGARPLHCAVQLRARVASPERPARSSHVISAGELDTLDRELVWPLELEPGLLGPLSSVV
jgi:hypothetical protein